MNRPSLSLLLIAVVFSLPVLAQQKWDLRQCIAYALDNNISVKQQDVQARITKLQYDQSKWSQYPTASLSGNAGFSSGRNQNPVTFGLITQSYFFSNYNLQAGAELFNWFSKKNEIAGNEFQYKAAQANVDKWKDDIALNVAGAYLQVLLAREQISVSQIQVKQTTSQLENTRKLVKAGSLPELNAVQLEAQLANDSSILVSAQGGAAQAILNLKALLSLDAATPFEIVTPDINSIPVENLADLQPELVYALAIKNLPQQRGNEFRIKASEKYIDAAKAARYPTFSLFGSLGTSFNNRAEQITGITPVNVPVGKVTVNGTQYDVFSNQAMYSYNYDGIPYFSQLDQNFRQSVGLSVSVPIANGGVLRGNYQRSKLNLKTAQLQKEADDQKLKQDIYKAYNDVITSTAKFNATGRQVDAAQRAYDFSTRRYNVGLLNTIDLITAQNNLFSAQLQRLLAQYDFVFKMKVLEFYKGQGLKL